MPARARDERLALNETIFRTANERMKAWEERHEHARSETYYCECSEIDCRDRVQLSAAQYEAVRADARRFVVATGHEVEDIEHVVDRGAGYNVVEKDADVDHIVEATDPRS